jgi:hypothetical protein
MGDNLSLDRWQDQSFDIMFDMVPAEGTPHVCPSLPRQSFPDVTEMALRREDAMAGAVRKLR